MKAITRLLPCAILSVVLCMLSVVNTEAADNTDVSVPVIRPVASAFTIGAGSASLADTYLTPLRYSGSNLSLQYERMQAMRFSPDRWVMQLNVGIDADITENPARNADMYRLSLQASWAMMHRWRLPRSITLAIGGSTGIDGGAIYNRRNGNNPVAGKAAWTIGLKGFATWSTRISRLPILLRYQAELPVTGVFFSPDYGELYYEIWLGNHNGLAHAAWWGNYFVYNHSLTADLALGSTRLRIGYRGDIFSSRVSNITSRVITHSFILGIVNEWISIPSRRGASTLSPSARIISSLY